MALLNYTTTIGVYKTLGEIQQILINHGAKKIMQEYDDAGHISTLVFSIMTPEGERGIQLPANVPAIYEVMKQQKAAGKIRTAVDYEQAERVAWRILKDWIDAQMAILESRMVELEEIFLPYMVINRQGATFFEAYKHNQLSAGIDEEV